MSNTPRPGTSIRLRLFPRSSLTSHLQRWLPGLAAAAVLAGCAPCSTFDGSVEINTQADWDRFAQQACPVVTGSLSFTHFFTAEKLAPSASFLKEVRGALSLSAVTAIDFPALTTVGAQLNAPIGSPLATLNVPELASVAGDLWFDQTALTSVSLPKLKTVGGTLSFGSNKGLSSLDAPALTAVGHQLLIHSEPITSLSLPALAAVGGGFEVYDTSLRQCAVDALLKQLTAPPTSQTVEKNTGQPNTCP